MGNPNPTGTCLCVALSYHRSYDSGPPTRALPAFPLPLTHDPAACWPPWGCCMHLVVPRIHISGFARGAALGGQFILACGGQKRGKIRLAPRHAAVKRCCCGHGGGGGGGGGALYQIAPQPQCAWVLGLGCCECDMASHVMDPRATMQFNPPPWT
jgi:hypothetical protein